MKNLYRRYYRRLRIPTSAADKTIYLLSNRERKAIQRLEYQAIIISGIIGTLGVLLLYLPQYQFPHFFLSTDIQLPIVGTIAIPVVATLYGVILVFLEIWALTILHVYCIHHMAVATGYITDENKYLREKQEKLLAISTEEKDKTLRQFGIDPYQGMKTAQLWFFNILIALKATLSNMLIKILVRRILGRYAIREVLDLLGIPIFAFWNIMATRTVLREARVMIMGQNMIDSFIPYFNTIALKIKDLPETKVLIYDTLQFIAVSKRDYHINHAYLTAKVLPIFEIPIEDKHPVPVDYVHRLASAKPNVQQLCQFLIIIGLLLDGQISWRERQKLQQFQQNGIISLSTVELTGLKNEFLEGKGVAQLIEKYLMDKGHQFT
jgi:hypothetical protein